MYRDECQPRTAAERGDQLPRLVGRHAELVRFQTGRDVRMTPGVDVGIDANRHSGVVLHAGRDGFDPRELARRFDVDRLESQRDGAFELGVRLAHAGKHDVRWREASPASDVELPHRVGVDRRAERPEQPDERERRICLQRVVHPVGIGAEGLVERAIPLTDEGGAVDVHRRAHFGGNRSEWHAVAHELGILEEEA